MELQADPAVTYIHYERHDNPMFCPIMSLLASERHNMQPYTMDLYGL